jgi:uncharacterized membrane protein YeaQ/YmgE (transglycosylase-associated protein family)
MHESLIVVLLIGLLVGWMAGNILRFSGMGLAGDLAVGLVGAFLGHWLLPAMHIHLGYGLAALVADATVGAVVLLLLFKSISFSRNRKGSAETVSRGFERCGEPQIERGEDYRTGAGTGLFDTTPQTPGGGRATFPPAAVGGPNGHPEPSEAAQAEPRLGA